MKGIGDQVNIETDMLGKYVLHHLKKINQKEESKITLEFLTQKGF